MSIKPGKVRMWPLRSAGGIALTALLSGMALISPALRAQVQTFSAPGGFGPVAGAFPLMTSLKTAANPVLPRNPTNGLPALRADLAEYIANPSAAIQLGKALFWEMQAGSDNKTACATCHYHAGADRRDKNQINPGANGIFNSTGLNSSLQPSQFPFTTPTTDSDDIAGSQGVRASAFQGIDNKTGAELTATLGDPVFNVNGVNVRQVTGKNAPSVINAVFNHRQFHNGRAQAEFNGVNPFGYRDVNARVWECTPKGGLATVDIKIANASLASQAVGPALNSVEMSAANRTFPDLGRKLLLAKPLGLQKVDPTDSVLGSLADTTTGKGLKVPYATLIQQAFQPKWWNIKNTVNLGPTNYTEIVGFWSGAMPKYRRIGKLKADNYAMMESNFSLIWGLALMLYEATLVSDDSPMDQYLDSGRTSTAALDAAAKRISADLPGVTSLDILQGLALAELPLGSTSAFPTPAEFGGGVGCVGCHAGPETTSASVAHITIPRDPEDIALKNAGFDMRMERMLLKFPPVPVGSDQITFDPVTHNVTVTSSDGTPLAQPLGVPVGTYDTGWYNLGVRPTVEDPGLDGQDPFGNYLSWTRLFQAYPDPTFIAVPGSLLGSTTAGNGNFPGTVVNAAGFPFLSGSLLANEPVDVAGTFKVLPWRNVELSGPYFHNGGKATLMQVVDFYNEGGEFANPTRHPNIRPLMLSSVQARNLVAFLIALTDERVRWQRAPFDHPQLFVPNGDTVPGTDSLVEIPAVGAAGASTPLPRFLNLNPFQP